MSRFMRVLSLSSGVLLLSVASLVIYKTMEALSQREKLSFLYMLPCSLLFLLIIVLRNFSDQRQHQSVQRENDRFLSMYDEIKQLHLFQKKQSMIYWNWAIGALFFGWTTYHFLDVFFASLSLRPGIIGIIFFAAFLLATRGIEKQKVVDEKLVNTTLKGLQIESRLALTKYHYFSHFVKARRGMRLFFFLSFRIAPILLIIFPLAHYSLIPMVGNWISWSLYLMEGIILGISFLALAAIILLPYVKLLKRCRLRVNVLQ